MSGFMCASLFVAHNGRDGVRRRAVRNVTCQDQQHKSRQRTKSDKLPV